MIYGGYVSWVGSLVYYAVPAQSLTAAGEELDDLDHDMTEVCAGGSEACRTGAMLGRWCCEVVVWCARSDRPSIWWIICGIPLCSKI